MVELCELKLMARGMGCDEDYWPSDIDQHVAQLDFGDNSSSMGQSVFASVMLDPSLISTDSLDMETLRARCENNKNNDYKLMFEDSGQWTTSGIGGSFTTTNTTASPPTPSTRRRQRNASNQNTGAAGGILFNHNFSLRLLEELNRDLEGNEATKRQIIDNLLNNTAPGEVGRQHLQDQMTTWGRIRTAEPPFDEKTNSLPELYNARRIAMTEETNRRNTSAAAVLTLPAPPPRARAPDPVRSQSGNNSCSSSRKETSTAGKSRPPSLLANFVEQQQQQQLFSHQQPPSQEQPPLDYEYSEVYMGNGRYVDVNENEIGYVPESTASIQKSSDRWRNYRTNNGSREFQPSAAGSVFSSRYAHASLTVPASIPESPSTRPSGSKGSGRRFRRTFADLSPSQTAPDLNFLSLPHKVPGLCRPSASVDDLVRRMRRGGGTLAEIAESCADERFLMDASSTIPEETRSARAALPSNDVCGGSEPDSGLGSSSNHSSGPLHIEDWSSLAVLLPRHVVEACSFFKTHSSLLTGSASNNIDRKPGPATAFRPAGFRGARRVNSANAVAQLAATTTPSTLANVATTTSEILSRELLPSASRARLGLASKLRLHAQELRLVGLPLYDSKRSLVERVVEGVAEVTRGGSTLVLWSALERVLQDDLREKVTPWDVVVRVTGPGPVTNSIFQLVRELGASEKPKNSRLTHFFKGLLNLRSLDGWLSYVVLKENVLQSLYTDDAFLLKANSAYRSLFWRLIESLELLTVLFQTGKVRGGVRRSQTLGSDANGLGSIYHSTNAEELKPPSSWGSASRLPSDSRIPKSSSVPLRLSRSDEKSESSTSIVVEVFGTESPLPISNEPATSKILQIVTNVALDQGERKEDQMRRSRIPVSRASLDRRSVSRQRSGSSLGHPEPIDQSISANIRSRSMCSRRSKFLMGRARETIRPNGGGAFGGIFLHRGEPVRVLSVRGDYSHCCRIRGQVGQNRLMISNGRVPTKFLELH